MYQLVSIIPCSSNSRFSKSSVAIKDEDAPLSQSNWVHISASIVVGVKELQYGSITHVKCVNN